jgi:mannose-6-phosphate isomerase-like protein (cupin superfamily)
MGRIYPVRLLNALYKVREADINLPISLQPFNLRGDIMLKNKVIIDPLPLTGDDRAERRLFSAKGEMAQILNRDSESYKHLVYWDLDSTRSGEERGHHYHGKKTENFYVLTGEFDLLVHDLETDHKGIYVVKAGDRLQIAPGVAHAFRSKTYSQALEYSAEQYDPADTKPYRVSI